MNQLKQQMRKFMEQTSSKKEQDYIIYTYDTTRIEVEDNNDIIELSLSQGDKFIKCSLQHGEAMLLNNLLSSILNPQNNER